MEENDIGSKRSLVRQSLSRKKILVSRKRKSESEEENDVVGGSEMEESTSPPTIDLHPLQLNIQSILDASSKQIFDSTPGIAKKSLKYTFCASFVHHIFYQYCWIDVPFNIFESRMKELQASLTSGSKRLSLKERRAIKFYEELLNLFDCFDIMSQMFEMKEMHFGCGASLFNMKCHFQLLFCGVVDGEVTGRVMEKMKRSLLQRLIQSTATTPARPFSSSVLKSPIHFAVQLAPKPPHTMIDIRRQYSDCPRLSEFFSWHEAALHFHQKKHGARPPLTVQIVQGEEVESSGLETVWLVTSTGIKPP